MNYQEFIENIKEHIQSQFDASYKVIVQPVIKNNGTILDGLIIIDPILNISPTIYLNPYYHRYLNDASIEDIYEEILCTYRDNLPKEDFDISSFKDFTKAKEHIIIKLVNREKNRELLDDVPYIPFYDLAMIFVVAVCDFMNEFATILIHNQHLELWDISLDELYQIAIHNTPNLLSSHFEPMEKVLEHLDESSAAFPTDLNMYLLTNHVKIHGATCMVYPGLLKHIADELEDNLIVIPSSIHEVLIIPYSACVGEYTISDFNDMVLEVNETQLTDDEVLANHVYFYIRSDDKLIY